MFDKEDARRIKEKMTAAAFTAWLQGAGGEKNFEDYLRGLGLAEKTKPITDEKKKELADKARMISERIMAMDKKRPVES